MELSFPPVLNKVSQLANENMVFRSETRKINYKIDETKTFIHNYQNNNNNKIILILLLIIIIITKQL
jgi:hypothetical protein